MLRKLSLGGSAIRCVGWSRSIATAVFVSNIQRIQSELSTADNKRELQHTGRLLYENEELDDVVVSLKSSAAQGASSQRDAMTPDMVRSIATVATLLRVAPSKSQPFQRTVDWALQPRVVQTMDDMAIARLLHASLVLSEPKIFELLFTYLWRVVELAPTLSGVSCAMIINAYGRCGIRHEILYKSLCLRATTALLEEGVTMGHIANVANALSRVGVADTAVFQVISNQSIRFEKQAPPLVMATILDAFSTVGIVDDSLFSVFEAHLERLIEECGAPLMATIVGALAKAKRSESPLFAAVASRATRIVNSYDPSSIARTLDAFYQVRHCSEEFFGLLAERAVNVSADFRPDEIHLTLRALSAFELYDAELFPLLASKLMSAMRAGGSNVPPDVVIGVLAAFATVHERHEGLIHAVSLSMKPFLSALSAELFTTLLWAFAELNARNDTTRAMVSEVQTHSGRLLTTDNLPSSWTPEVLAARLDTVKKVYGITGNIW
mmetsp:Transcript_81928/g.95696  ORF Transcript_81928/g.95696 Transcript_81928/m.95696 type:complete len:495 (+) Transcript_81928:34-1518(+)